MSNIYFFDEVHDFQRFVRENIRLLGNYTIISEQLTMKSNEHSIIDMLVVDNEEKRLVILELKNEITTDKNIWQPIRYYDLIKRGEDDLKILLMNASHKIQYPIEEINLNPELVLVVPSCNEQLLRTLSYFNDVDLKVVSINRKKINNSFSIDKKVFYPKSIVHTKDTTKIINKVSNNWSLDEYIKHGISKDKIKVARKMINLIKTIFENKGYSFDVFFTETKITITKNNKVWGHFFIKQQPLNYKLTFSFKVDPKIVNKNDFFYNYSIDSFDVQKNGLKLKLNSELNIDLLNKYL